MKGQPKSRIHSPWIVIFVTVLLVIVVVGLCSFHVTAFCWCFFRVIPSAEELHLLHSSHDRREKRNLKEINSGVTENEGTD